VSAVAFLWFVAVIRRRVGDREDRFFVTVFEFRSTAGGHIGAINDNATEVVAAVQSFIAKATGT
jgi:hypothetical protein